MPKAPTLLSCLLAFGGHGLSDDLEISNLQSATSELREELAQAEIELETLPRWLPSGQQHGRVGFHGVATDSAYLLVDLERETTPDEVVLFPAKTSPGEADSPSGFPPELEVELSHDPTFATFRRLGRWLEKSPGAGTRLPMLRLPGNGISGRYLRVRIFGSRARPSGLGRYFSFGEIVVLEQGSNVALGKHVETSQSIENPLRWQRRNLTDGFLWCLPFAGPRSSPGNGFHSGIHEKATVTQWVEIDLGQESQIDEIRLIPAHPQDFADTAGFGFPPRFRLLKIDEEEGENLLVESGPGTFPNPGSAAVMLALPGTQARRIRFETDRLWRRTDDYLMALGEMQALSDGVNRALGAKVLSGDSTETGTWSEEALTDGFSSRHELLSWNEWLDGLSRREFLEDRQRTIGSLLEQRAVQNRKRWIIGSGAATLLIAVLAWLAIRRQRREAVLAQEQLRQRIASDLHDELGASLSHLALQGELAASELDSDADRDARARLARLSDTARTTLDDMRDVIWLLGEGPGSWSEFASRLETICERLLEGMDHGFRMEGHCPPGRPPIEWAREVVLFLKETLTNARRHSGGDEVTVTLTWNEKLKLLIEDNGSGFQLENARSRRRSGLGLNNLQERATRLSGTLTIDSRPETGTTIRLVLPYPEPKS